MCGDNSGGWFVVWDDVEVVGLLGLIVVDVVAVVVLGLVVVDLCGGSGGGTGNDGCSCSSSRGNGTRYDGCSGGKNWE